MGLDVGKVSIEYLPRPEEAAYEFARHLAEKASCWGDGNSFGFYNREEMAEMAMEFLTEMGATPQQVDEVNAWIESLPWDESGYLTRTFNW